MIFRETELFPDNIRTDPPSHRVPLYPDKEDDSYHCEPGSHLS